MRLTHSMRSIAVTPYIFQVLLKIWVHVAPCPQVFSTPHTLLALFLRSDTPPYQIRDAAWDLMGADLQSFCTHRLGAAWHRGTVAVERLVCAQACAHGCGMPGHVPAFGGAHATVPSTCGRRLWDVWLPESPPSMVRSMLGRWLAWPTSQTPPTLCLPQCALKPTVLAWRKPFNINDWPLTCRRRILSLRGFVAHQANAYRGRSA
jgi:hypothetical protein